MPTGANSVSNVTAGKPKVGGSIYRAPIGTDVPTDATTALDTAFKCLGYVSDEGVTNSTSIESEDIKAWGGDTVLTPQTGKTDNFQLALLESLNVEALKAYFGDENVTGTDIKTGLSVKCNSKELQPCVWVVEMIAAGNIPHRVVIPNAKPTEMEDITYVDNKPVSMGLIPAITMATYTTWKITLASLHIGRQRRRVGGNMLVAELRTINSSMPWWPS